MGDVAIRAQGLGKRYRIGALADPYKTLRESIAGLVTSPARRLRALAHGWGRAQTEEIWAVRGIDLEVRLGEVLGVIGRNGAGKTTLLKILSRITEPTTGRVELHGRIGSLLEVGTGFHPELTGKENIFLNGAILGMRRADVRRRFEEIVDFAEVEKFLNTPVKRYSSGMYMRLAFAVAAHLDSEILLIDEVLAVGDAAFQRRCLGKMDEVARGGKTVIFVSHNMAAITGLCTRCICLKNGRVVTSGAPDSVVRSHLEDSLSQVASVMGVERSRRGNGRLRFRSVEAAGVAGPMISGKAAYVLLRYESSDQKPLRDVHVALGVRDSWGNPLFHLSTEVSGRDFALLPPEGTLVCQVAKLPLQPGLYRITVFCRVCSEVADWIENAVEFEVSAGDFFATGRLPPATQGPLLVPHQWERRPHE